MADPFAQFQDADQFAQFQDAPKQAVAKPPQTSQALGAWQGFMQPLDNVASAMDRGAKSIGINLDPISHSLGIPTTSEAIQSHADYLTAQKAKGVQPGGWGKFAGNVAGTLPTALVSSNPIVAGALSAAALSDAKSPTDLAKDTAIGGIGGKLGSMAINGISSIVRPTVSKGVQLLLDEGAKLTPGQILGGATKRVEDAATSIPLIGDMIKSGQRQAIRSVNTAAGNRALSPVGQSLPANADAGHDMVDYVSTKLGDAYDNVLPKLSATYDQQFHSDLSNIVANANLPPAQMQRLQQIVTAQLAKATGGSVTGPELKGIDEELGKAVKGYTGPNEGHDNRQLGDTLDNIRGAVRDMLIRQNPQQASVLQNINKGYANYARVRTAASSVTSPEGVFTPAQLYSATRAGDASQGHGAFAKGQSLMQDLAGAAKNNISSNVPDSGTATRSMVGLAATGALAHVNIPAALSVLAATGAYTKPGLAILQTVLTKRPQAAAQIAQLIAQGKTPAAIAAANAAVQASSPGR